MSKQKGFLDRLVGSSCPPAAALGAFTSFAAALNPKSAASAEKPPAAPLVQIGLAEPPQRQKPVGLELEYARTLVFGGENSTRPFLRSLSGIAAGPSDRIFAIGDGELRIYESDGTPVRSWKAPEGATVFAVDATERLCFAVAGRIEIYDSSGKQAGGFAIGGGEPASVTAVKAHGREILVADAAARLIRRYTFNGVPLGTIGAHGKIRGFMLPNRSLDIDVDANGVIRAADSGRHRVSSWTSDGALIGQFGRFGLRNPEDFVGCCNPVNLAVFPNGNIATAEKVVTRVKVYNPEGKLLAVIGPEHFDPKCIHLHLAVDSQGRLLVADPVRREIQVFSARSGSGDVKNV